MYNRKKSTALLLTLVMVFSIALSPFTAAYASQPSFSLPTLKPPTVTATPDISKVNLETPARVQGVEYEFKNNVKQFPKMINYEFKTLTLDQFASFDLDAAPQNSTETSDTTGTGPSLPNVNISGGSTNQLSMPAESTNGLRLEQINGIRFPAGSKILSIPKNLSASFTPKLNDIYVDEEEGVAFRILDAMEADSDGNAQYVVETPQLTDIFESYSIPKQTLNLTTGNICYIAPEFELSPDSGMPKNYMADSGIVVYENKYIECRTDGNKHIMKLKPGTVLFEYPDNKKDSEKDKIEKKKFNWRDEQYSDLRGFEEESSLKVKIKIKEGEVVVEDPEFHAEFELNKWTSHVSADFYFDAKAKADVTLEGDLTFNKTVEKCVYGYDIDLGKVMGKKVQQSFCRNILSARCKCKSTCRSKGQNYRQCTSRLCL